MKSLLKTVFIALMTTILLSQNLTFSMAAPNPEDYEAMTTKTAITDTEFAYGISTEEPSIIYNAVTIAPGGGAVVYKLPLPPESEGQKIEKYIFRHTSMLYPVSAFNYLKMPGDGWDMSSLRNTDDMISQILSSPSDYRADEGEGVYQTLETYKAYLNYVDLSGYANECKNNGQKNMYLIVTSSSTAKIFGYVTDTDYIKAGMSAYYYYSYGEADPLEFISANPADRSESIYVEFATFTYNNGIASANAVVNGENAQCICNGTKVIVDFALEEYEDYEISVSVTDTYGQSEKNFVRFSTGGGSGAVSTKDGGTSYAVKATGTIESNRNSIDLDTNNFMLYKIPLPDLLGQQSLGSFVFNYTVLGKSEDSTLLMFPGDEWEVSSMTITDENVNEVISAYLTDGKETSFNAAASKTVTKVSNTLFKVSVDITAYAEECINNGQEFMWLGSVSTSTMNCYGFGYSDDYDPMWSYATMNPMYKVTDAKVSIEENSLTELSFKLLTSDENINDSIVLKNVTSQTDVPVSFEYDLASGRFDISEAISLDEGASYEVIIRSGAEDDYGNVLSSDITVTKFCNVSFEASPEKTEDNPNLSVDINIDAGVIDVYYKNSYYANRKAKIAIVNTEYDEVLYDEEHFSNARGTLTVDDISISESGNYMVSVYPEYSDSFAQVLIRYYTNDDALCLWDIAAISGNAQDISDNWNDLKNFLELKEDNLEYVIDNGDFYSKLAEQRPEGLEEYNEDNKKLYVAFSDTMALFTALEQCEDVESLKILTDRALVKIKAYDPKLSVLWSSCVDSDYYEDVIEAFCDSDVQINTVADLSERMSDAVEIYRADYNLELISNVEHGSEISAIISDEKVAKALGISEYMDDFNKLKSKSSVEKALTKNFEDAESFAKAFKTAVKKALDAQSEKKRPSSGNSSSSSGNFGGARNFTAAGNNKAPEYASSQNMNTQSPFVDLSDYEWAKTHIDSLYSLGVINGKTEKEFKPADNIKREEFVKLIVTLLKLEITPQGSSFNDVEAGSWYESYVNTAVSNDIVNGIGDNLFGTGKNASRQDIAVMIANALKNNGIQISSANVSFGDSQNIADYAKESVAFLASKGVITGDTSGNFNPENNASRAEVAVMISRVYNIFLKEVR